MGCVVVWYRGTDARTGACTQSSLHEDTDGDGNVSYTDFLAAGAHSRVLDDTALCWEVFRSFDLNGNGSVSRRELQDILDTPAVEGLFDRKWKKGLLVFSTKSELKGPLAELGGSCVSVDEIFKAPSSPLSFWHLVV